MDLLTPTWWEAAGQRAAYTALAALLPLAALLVAGEVTVLYVLSVTGLALVASLLTSLVGLPEVDAKTVPLWRAVLVRVAKTAGQVAAPVIGAAALLEDVDWTTLGTAVAGAALTTLVRTLMAYLPETPGPIEATVEPGGVVITTLRAAEVADARSLRDALDPGDPSRAVLDRILPD